MFIFQQIPSFYPFIIIGVDTENGRTQRLELDAQTDQI